MRKKFRANRRRLGKLLQDILDLLATASSDTERKILDDWKALLSQYTVVYDVAHATGMADMEHMFLTLKGRSLRNGASFTSSVPLHGAIRKGWNVVGKADTLTFDPLEQVKIKKNMFSPPDIDTSELEDYQLEARFFVKEAHKDNIRYTAILSEMCEFLWKLSSELKKML